VNSSVLACACTILLLPAHVLAQDAGDPDRQSYFGAIVNFGLPSDFRDDFKWVVDADQTSIRSQDFEIGFIVRGRQLGGDWGVSYFQRNFKSGSTAENLGESCSQNACFLFGRRDIMQDVQLRGVFFYKFAPFVTIKRRAQIGVTFGGGISQARGPVERHEFDTEFRPPNSQVQTETVTVIDAKEMFLDGHSVPLWKVEITGAILVAPGLKVRVGGGLQFTNYPAMSISASYLFGAK
jgi:hypothetical protein